MSRMSLEEFSSSLAGNKVSQMHFLLMFGSMKQPVELPFYLTYYERDIFREDLLYFYLLL